MTKKNGTPVAAVKVPMTVAKLFGRCLTVTVGGEAFEVKVMGERLVATVRREQLIAALVAGGATEVPVPVFMPNLAARLTTTKGDD